MVDFRGKLLYRDLFNLAFDKVYKVSLIYFSLELSQFGCLLFLESFELSKKGRVLEYGKMSTLNYNLFYKAA